MTASKLPSGDKLSRGGASPWIIIAAAAIIIVIVASVMLIPGLSSTGTKSVSSSRSSIGTTTTSSQSNESTSVQELTPMSASCVTVVPYDSIQKQFAGCGYTFAVLYNGDYYTQKFANGTIETNLGWTLLIEASQNCRCGPSENVTFGWDPAGPLTAASGERLPAPASSTLLDGNLTIQWRLYGSTPLLYAWIIASTLSAPQQSTTTSTESTSTSCPTASWPSQISTSYQSVVQEIEQNPAFVALTNRLCYSLTLNDYGESGGQSLTTFIFNQYNGTVFYPCGTFPANLTVSQIQVTVFNGTTTNEISSMWLDNQTASLNVYNCPLANTPVWVHSVLIVPPYTPAGPTVEVTLRADLEQAPITNLTAVLALTGREPFQSQTQTFRFVAVNASNPLLAGQFSLADRDDSGARNHLFRLPLLNEHLGDLPERPNLQLRRPGRDSKRPCIGKQSTVIPGIVPEGGSRQRLNSPIREFDILRLLGNLCERDRELLLSRLLPRSGLAQPLQYRLGHRVELCIHRS